VNLYEIFLMIIIREFKGYHSKSSDELPTPGRYVRSAVKNIAVTPLGKLKIDTEFDDHVFRVGIIRKSKLREALIRAGFL